MPGVAPTRPAHPAPFLAAAPLPESDPAPADLEKTRGKKRKNRATRPSEHAHPVPGPRLVRRDDRRTDVRHRAARVGGHALDLGQRLADLDRDHAIVTASYDNVVIVLTSINVLVSGGLHVRAGHDRVAQPLVAGHEAEGAGHDGYDRHDGHHAHGRRR